MNKQFIRRPVIIITGNGKGKTTAAVGSIIRMLGNGYKAGIIQFVKSQESGEIKYLKNTVRADVYIGGKGFLNKGKREEHINAAKKTFKTACDWVDSNKYDMIVLDEIFYVLKEKMIDIKDVVKLIENKPYKTSVILTGRNAPNILIKKADYVTECLEIKHPYNTAKSKPVRGIEF